MVIIFTISTFAQETIKERVTPRDSAQKVFKLQNDVLRMYLNRSKFFNGEFSLAGNNLNSEIDFSQLNSGEALHKGNPQGDPLAYFKKYLYKSLALQYGEIPNYDLGAIGKYLGYLKILAALILAAKSIR